MTSHALPGARRRISLTGLFQAILARKTLRLGRRRLTQLDDHLLRDIGISRDEALAEASRTDWDAPAHWYR